MSRSIQAALSACCILSLTFIPVGAVLAAAATDTQTWPSKPIRWIVPFARGGGVDVTARTIAQRLGRASGQQLVIDNRGGALGNIGVELAGRLRSMATRCSWRRLATS
jgi:tripartite-type tricarboxylate transporter receptor subunit TctC